MKSYCKPFATTLKDCRGGRQLSKMNKTQLLEFLECIDDIELAQEYRAQAVRYRGIHTTCNH
eukprot:COSAG02_NODE_62994_length_264_cov_0.878788_1_plen_61_part_10